MKRRRRGFGEAALKIGGYPADGGRRLTDGHGNTIGTGRRTNCTRIRPGAPGSRPCRRTLSEGDAREWHLPRRCSPPEASLMARACRFTQPYGSREIYHDGKPFIEIHRAVNKFGTGSSRPVDVDTVGREIGKLLCGEKKTKSALAGARRRRR